MKEFLENLKANRENIAKNQKDQDYKHFNSIRELGDPKKKLRFDEGLRVEDKDMQIHKEEGIDYSMDFSD